MLFAHLLCAIVCICLVKCYATIPMFCAFVAQGTEHRSPKAGVGRSNRPGGAIFCWRYQVQCCCSVHFHGCCRCFVRVVSFRSRCCRGFFSFTLLPRSFPFPLVQFCVTFRRRCAYCFAPPSTSRPLPTRIAFAPAPRAVRSPARMCPILFSKNCFTVRHQPH